MSPAHAGLNRSWTLWGQTFDDNSDVYQPLTLETPVQNAITFVEINPSFPNDIDKWLQEAKPGALAAKEYFAWKNRRSFDTEVSNRVDEIARREANYFSLIKQFSGQVGVDWQALDPYQYRDSTQSEIVKFLKEKPKFQEEQLSIFGEMLALSRPKLILVANATTRDTFMERFNPIFDERRGYHHTGIGGRKVPTFFSSMLSSSGALDKGSRQRLFWHCRQALGK